MDRENAQVHAFVEQVARARLQATMGEAAEPVRIHRRALLIVNSKSGKDQRSLLKLREIVDILAGYGIGVDVRVKLRKSVARKQARNAAARGCSLVIAAGGDGTVAAVARGLIGTRTTLGVVPLGTYNNTATSLGVPTDLHAACALIAAGLERKVDVGQVQVAGKRKPAMFLEMGAVGLPTALTLVGQHLEKGRVDAARKTLPVALELPPTLTRVHLDETPPAHEARTLCVLISNGPRTGAGIDVASRARMDDGLLDVQVYDDQDQAELATRFLATLATDFDSQSGAWRARAAAVRVETTLPLPVLADSKFVGTTPATFRVLPGSLRVIAGNGPALTRPVADTAIQEISSIARALPPGDDGHPAFEPRPKDLVVRALSEAVPVVLDVAGRARSVGRAVAPIAVAALGGVLLAPALRRLSGLDGTRD